MTHYLLRQTRESLSAKPSLLDEIVESYQGSGAFKVLDRTERMISVNYTGTLEELQRELKSFPEVKVSEEVIYKTPEQWQKDALQLKRFPPIVPSPKQKRR